MSSPRSDPSASGDGTDERQALLEREFRRSQSRRHVPWWWPLVPQTVGLLGIVYELLFDKLDRPWIMVGCTTLAVGGRFADAVGTVARDYLRGGG